jgi:hypothetical protein
VKCGSSAKRRRSEKGLPVLEGERRSDAGDPIRPRLCQEAERDLRELRITLPHLAGLGERIDDFAIAVDRRGERPFGLQIAVEGERAARGQHERLRGELEFVELEGAAVAPRGARMSGGAAHKPTSLRAELLRTVASPLTRHRVAQFQSPMRPTCFRRCWQAGRKMMPGGEMEYQGGSTSTFVLLSR